MSTEIKSLSGNKGEWSEVYVLLKIISDKYLTTGDNKLNSFLDFVYPIIQIIRSNTSGDVTYAIKDEIVEIVTTTKTSQVSLQLFKDKTLELFESIKTLNNSEGIPSIEDFLQQIAVTSLKAKSSSKSDIRIIIHDPKTGLQPILGFSIKSQLGSASTLLNASGATNFIFKIIDGPVPSTLPEVINAIETNNKVKDRVNAIYAKNFRLKYVKCQSVIFQNNLILIDSCLPDIIAEMLIQSYIGSTNLLECLKAVELRNPIGFDLGNKHPYYAYKIKKLLVDIAVGMTPTKTWDGVNDATGGYLIVKQDGDVVCYHMIERNSFENYLLNNTKFETASTARHGFGQIYHDIPSYYFKLNLQIRFTS